MHSRNCELRIGDVTLKLCHSILTILSSAINLIIAYAQSVKHKIRHEPEYDYADLKPLINHLSTYSKQAREGDIPVGRYNDTMRKGFGTWGEYLGLPIFTSNPRKKLKQYAKAGVHHGNLPLEIMNYLSAYIGSLMKGGQMAAPVFHTQVFNSMALMLDSYGGCERVLQTPLPVAYNIAISQITWLYTMVGIIYKIKNGLLLTSLFSGSPLPTLSEARLGYHPWYHSCCIHHPRDCCHWPGN